VIEDDSILIRVAPDLLSQIGTRTDDGFAITVEVGEPDAEGVYDPVFFAKDDGHVMVDADDIDAALAAFEASGTAPTGDSLLTYIKLQNYASGEEIE
jgi:hypothetical protein